MDLNVRRGLSELRRRWDAHSPEAPLCLAEDLVDEGVAVAEFCVRVLLHQCKRG